jgi:thiol-disulfide isomerase/thioredoxin
MKFLLSPIFYLESSDFDEYGNIVNPNIDTSLPIFIMIQANFCGFCTMAKPDFQQFAYAFKDKITCATIQADSERPDPNLKQLLSIIAPELTGFPSYIILYKNKIISYEYGRKFADMETYFNFFLTNF